MRKSEILKILAGCVKSYQVDEHGFLFINVRRINWCCLKDIMDYILFIRPKNKGEITIEFDGSVEID